MRINSKNRGFVEGTLVTMADGSQKPIEAIRPGDLVMSFDEFNASAGLEPREVIDIFNRIDGEILEVKTDSSVLKVAKDQMFIGPNNDWKEVYNHSFVVDEYGNRVKYVANQVRKGKHKVYDVTVDENHSLIANGLRVHNSLGDSSTSMDGSTGGSSYGSATGGWGSYGMNTADGGATVGSYGSGGSSSYGGGSTTNTSSSSRDGTGNASSGGYGGGSDSGGGYSGGAGDSSRGDRQTSGGNSSSGGSVTITGGGSGNSDSGRTSARSSGKSFGGDDDRGRHHGKHHGRRQQHHGVSGSGYAHAQTVNNGQQGRRKKSRRALLNQEPTAKPSGTSVSGKLLDSIKETIDVLQELITAIDTSGLTTAKLTIQTGTDSIYSYANSHIATLVLADMSSYDKSEMITMAMDIMTQAMLLRKPFEETVVSAAGKVQALNYLSLIELAVIRSQSKLEKYLTNNGNGQIKVEQNGQPIPKKRSRKGAFDMAGRRSNGSYSNPRGTTFGGGGSCFTFDTMISMSNGEKSMIGTVKAGDQVLGKNGTINTVVGVEVVTLGDRALYGFNGMRPFVSEEHPIMTDRGWGAFSKESLLKYEPQVYSEVVKENALVDIVEGTKIVSETGIVELTELDKITTEHKGLKLYNLLLDNNHTYFANGILVHNKASDGGGSSYGGGLSGTGSGGGSVRGGSQSSGGRSDGVSVGSPGGDADKHGGTGGTIGGDRSSGTKDAGTPSGGGSTAFA